MPLKPPANPQLDPPTLSTFPLRFRRYLMYPRIAYVYISTLHHHPSVLIALLQHMSRFRPKTRPDANLSGGDHVHGKRTRSEGVNADKKKDIEMAKKKDNLKEVKRRRSLPFVFVGNVCATPPSSPIRQLILACVAYPHGD